MKEGARVSHPFVTPAVMSGCQRGLANCRAVTLMDAGERPDFLPKYSSVKSCLLSSLYEPVAESRRDGKKMRNWASRIDEGDNDKNKR